MPQPVGPMGELTIGEPGGAEDQRRGLGNPRRSPGHQVVDDLLGVRTRSRCPPVDQLGTLGRREHGETPDGSLGFGDHAGQQDLEMFQETSGGGGVEEIRRVFEGKGDSRVVFHRACQGEIEGHRAPLQGDRLEDQPPQVHLGARNPRARPTGECPPS